MPRLTQPSRHNRHNPLPKSVEFDSHSSQRLWLAVSESAFFGVGRPSHSILPHGVGLIRKSRARGRLHEERIGAGQSVIGIPRLFATESFHSILPPICRPPSF